MVFEYCTVGDVSNELNGLTIDGSSNPSSTTVEGWIRQASVKVNDKTKKVWSSTDFDINIDYDGKRDINIQQFPLLTITSLQYNKASLGQTPDWVTMVEDTDFVIYDKEGVISLINTIIPAGRLRLKIVGTYGYATTPQNIVELTALIVAHRLIGTVLNESGTAEGGAIQVDVISIDDPSMFGKSNQERINNNISNLIKDIGVLKSYRLRRRVR